YRRRSARPWPRATLHPRDRRRSRSETRCARASAAAVPPAAQPARTRTARPGRQRGGDASRDPTGSASACFTVSAAAPPESDWFHTCPLSLPSPPHGGEGILFSLERTVARDANSLPTEGREEVRVAGARSD